MIKVLYEDKHIVCAVKPVGVLSEDTQSGACMPSLLREATGSRYIGAVHRLDMGVGGVMVYAKTPQAAAKMSACVASHKLAKEYLAIICGTPENESGNFTDLLFKDSRKNKSYVVDRMRKGVKEASLDYSLLGSQTIGELATSLVRVRLNTGRSHQIRVQFASRKLPLLGDGKYGSRDSNCDIALFSRRLTFEHPITGKLIDISALPATDTYPWSEYGGVMNKV